ncbi:MAG: aspartyl/asparaginyl beta-hydroxylase domain-containing protein, partial [Rhodanobacteraceae bacterium]
MKLEVPFVQLPLAFDAERLLAEVNAIGEEAWRPHPQGYEGNSALPLISTNGDPDDDSVAGVMRPTPYLERCPTLVAALGALGAVWGRSRLMRLSGQAEVPAHADLSYYWRERVRVHVPILTQPTVRFICGEAEVNMAPGECWIFDTWRRHRVINDAARQRIHLVADTVGSEQFWEIASSGRVPGRPVPGWEAKAVAGSGNVTADDLAYESVNMPTVMSPWELRDHLTFLIGESAPHPQLAVAQQFSVRFNHVWLGLWARYGDAREGWPAYRAALDPFAKAMMQIGRPITLRNGSPFLSALGPMVLRAALADGQASGGRGDAGPDADALEATNPGAKTAAPPRSTTSLPGRSDPRFDRPVFIVSPPRSGSTLLFETLARAPDLYTVGGESHGRMEKLP